MTSQNKQSSVNTGSDLSAWDDSGGGWEDSGWGALGGNIQDLYWMLSVYHYVVSK